MACMALACCMLAVSIPGRRDIAPICSPEHSTADRLSLTACICVNAGLPRKAIGNYGCLYRVQYSVSAMRQA